MSPKETRPNPIVDLSTDSRGSPEADAGRALRERAEELAGERVGEIPENLEILSPEAMRRALHELQVHQIELEMQNEELRRTQEELEASRTRYFDLYDLAPVGYFTLSEQGLILEANLTAAKLLGVPRGALVKQPLSRFILPGDQDIHYRCRKQLLATGTPQSWELRLLRKDAAPFWARVEATTAQQDAGGNPVWRAVVSDISERKFEEEERAKLEAQNRQLQKAEGLARMAGAIAHHFNNHLTAVMGNLELVIGDLPGRPEPAEKLTTALLAAHAAAEVSKLMLTYLGQTRAQHESLDLSEVCRRSLPLLRAAMPKAMVLDTDLPSPGPGVSANANQIQQVLTNLVTNAWEAGVAGRGIVRVTVKTVPQADIPTSHHPVEWSPREGAYACLEVVDAGSGIADKDIEKIFDPFFSSKFAGRGLGLSVVLGIVRAHGGAVTVETAPGRGSSLRVFLPLSEERVIRQPDQAAQSPEIDGRSTVLLVDDEPMVRKVGEGALARIGFAVLLAKDGVEAVEVFRQHRNEVRCVLCDLTMPRMDGWETLAALRKLAPGLPVILVSGYDEAHVMAGDHLELPQAFLSKPYQLQGLRDAIGRALLQRKKPSGS